MQISIITAKSDNDVIGKAGGLPWSIPADERFLMEKIRHGYLLTGRKSFESNQGNTLFAGRQFVLITRHQDYDPGPGGSIAHSVEAGIAHARAQQAKQLWILGGAEIYQQALPYTDEMYITEIHTRIEGGDAFFPAIDPADWKEQWRKPHPADAENEYAYTFVYYRKRRNMGH